MTEQIAPDAGAGTPKPADGTVVPPVTPPVTPPVVTATPPVDNKGGAAPEAGKQATSEPQKPVVPTVYDLKLPKDSPLQPDAIEKKIADAKERGLTNEQAQKELESEGAIIASDRKAQAERVNAEWKKQNETWIADIKNDKEIGGATFEKNMELGKRVAAKYADPGFLKELNDTGFGNHPGLVRMLVKLGKEMGEDKFTVASAQPGERTKRPEHILYPTTSPKGA